MPYHKWIFTKRTRYPHRRTKHDLRPASCFLPVTSSPWGHPLFWLLRTQILPSRLEFILSSHDNLTCSCHPVQSWWSCWGSAGLIWDRIPEGGPMQQFQAQHISSCCFSHPWGDRSAPSRLSDGLPVSRGDVREVHLVTQCGGGWR